MRNARLGEAQAGLKIAGRNTDNQRYADDITLVAESKEELKSLLMMGKQWEQWETLFLGGSKITADGAAAMKLKDACSLEEKLWPT